MTQNRSNLQRNRNDYTTPVARSRQTDVVSAAWKNFPKIYSFSSISHHFTFRSKRFYSGKFITCVQSG